MEKISKEARVDYEYSPKIKIYEQIKEWGKKFLELEEHVTESDYAEREHHGKLFDNLDRVIPSR